MLEIAIAATVLGAAGGGAWLLWKRRVREKFIADSIAEQLSAQPSDKPPADKGKKPRPARKVRKVTATIIDV